jgi:hypothetical protein
VNAICSRNDCETEKGDLVVYQDSDHLTSGYAEMETGGSTASTRTMPCWLSGGRTAKTTQKQSWHAQGCGSLLQGNVLRGHFTGLLSKGLFGEEQPHDHSIDQAKSPDDDRDRHILVAH